MRLSQDLFPVLSTAWWFAYVPYSVAWYFTFERNTEYDLGLAGVFIDVYYWALLTPIILIVIWFGYSSSPSNVQLFAWNDKRPIWSSFWTVVALIPILLLLPFEIDFAIRGGLELIFSFYFFTGLLLLEWWRCAVVLRESRKAKST